jgi:lipopolysaccharide export LptBFGC system permease protein LptF
MLGAELLRGLALATGALVLAVAFGATVKPIAEGAIGALDAVKFMGVAIVPMLQYALPFGAGLAATLGYHRFASENEAIAASAGGIGYGAIIFPAVAIGVALGAGVYGLAGTAAPRFTRTLESIVTKDAARTIVRQIERGESVSIDEVILHADRAFRVGADPESGAIDYFILEGVVAAAVDDATGGLTADIATNRADVWLYPAERDGEDAVAVYMVVTGGVAKQEGETLIRLRKTEFGPWIIPGALGDDLDYMTDRELALVAADPERHRPVSRFREEAAAALGRARAASEVVETVRAQASLTLVDDEGGRLRVSDARVDRADNGAIVLAPAPGAEAMEIAWRRAEGDLRRLRTGTVRLDLDVTPRDRATRVAVELLDVSVEGEIGGAIGGDDEAVGRRESVMLGEGFALAADPAPAAFDLGALELVRVAEASSDAALQERGERLAKVYLDVRREAIANRHERAALATAGLIISPLGAVMALRLREKMPLVVYLWSFLPALGCVVAASGGAKVAEEHGDPGLWVIWGACGLFALFLLVEFWRLRRH